MAFGWFKRMAAVGEEISRLEAGLAPPTALVFDRLDAPLAQALDVVAADPGPLGRVLAEAREAGDWARHGHAVRRASLAALEAPQALLGWSAARPDDPDATVVRARLQVRLAWQARSAQRAARLSEAQIEGFFALLAEAEPTVRRARELAPGSPSAIEVALQHARGSEAGPQDVAELTAAGREVAPLEPGWQRAALLYHSPRWFGSAEQSWDFARSAAERAPADSLVRLLPAVSLADVCDWSHADPGSAPDDAVLTGLLDEAVAITHGLLRTTSRRADYLDAVNQLAYLLVVADRAADAYEPFQHAGAHVAEWPWQHGYDDPVAGFRSLRGRACAALAKRNVG